MKMTQHKPSTTDKSNIISPYVCKHEGQFENIESTLDKMDSKIDLLIDINSQLKVQQERIDNLEKRQQEITNRLWYIAGGTILALIGAFIQMLN